MKRFQLLLCAGIVLLLAGAAQARAAYKGPAEMIESAQIIAIVEITRLEKASTKGRHWTYGQKAFAKVERVLKGKVPQNVSLYGDEDFICARCHFAAGRYLVFLDRDGALLTGNNWHLSARKISGNSAQKVEWFSDKRIFEKNEVPLSSVINRIALKVAKAKRPRS